MALQILHVGRHSTHGRLWPARDETLDMTPLELVLVALEIEGIEHVRLDMTQLDEVRTVGDLVALFDRAAATPARKDGGS
jgi:hypothetical protein